MRAGNAKSIVEALDLVLNFEAAAESWPAVVLENILGVWSVFGWPLDGKPATELLMLSSKSSMASDDKTLPPSDAGHRTAFPVIFHLLAFWKQTFQAERETLLLYTQCFLRWKSPGKSQRVEYARIIPWKTWNLSAPTRKATTTNHAEAVLDGGKPKSEWEEAREREQRRRREEKKTIKSLLIPFT